MKDLVQTDREQAETPSGHLEPESLELKWGTLKGWDLKTEKTKGIMRRYIELGASYSAMWQRDTPEQKTLICDLIDALNGEVMNDWTGEIMSKDDAKEYVLNYNRNRGARMTKPLPQQEFEPK